ncbi:MAG: hypothetical protein A2694_02950 [Candidatus Blackburnbacteria bacterium RIFCSPHIGHO2_01_FULL_40_17]|uniref:Addiction module toxin RelE n=1 Tax=Candidatus Blackburnbacteria bacterium RIFCSPLOWO2_01_FULL_40_20 TaxID=1797519 RepID=A0A1G1VAK4_9BACT|nr:MAG: hypothetical protein A2694_02950 [Candidatus Blackburnbacteria bacterium RIFCSPHIGHO2_01_FULL_40_17]OGY12514.1 MAG: hypothetical protein A3A77_00900 [Candidatus Blackburnbacteria bacterium RIFCSPLOWO2_01_FULL_40_20]OGY15121.1 MAG: hypothetical protein A3I52_00015 [Candidatus Blackburnbacteria bacterium RIFCSPLOWO2_02_FULL_40_10]HBL51658.1 hypothetical protein [Candidatus Blackburnbacteria bacterium]
MNWDSSYEIFIDKKLPKIIKRNLPQNLKKVLDRKLKYLATNPNHPSLNTKSYDVSKQTLGRLEVDAIFEFYINMSFRCVFYVRQKEKRLIIAFVGNHEAVKNRYS